MTLPHMQCKWVTMLMVFVPIMKFNTHSIKCSLQWHDRFPCIQSWLLDNPSIILHFLWSINFKPKPYSKKNYFFFFYFIHCWLTIKTPSFGSSHLPNKTKRNIVKDRETERRRRLFWNTSLSKPYRVELTPLPLRCMGMYTSRYTLKLMKLTLCYTHQWITICVTLCGAHWLDATGSNTTLLYIITYIFRS